MSEEAKTKFAGAAKRLRYGSEDEDELETAINSDHEDMPQTEEKQAGRPRTHKQRPAIIPGFEMHNADEEEEDDRLLQFYAGRSAYSHCRGEYGVLRAHWPERH